MSVRGRKNVCVYVYVRRCAYVCVCVRVCVGVCVCSMIKKKKREKRICNNLAVNEPRHRRTKNKILRKIIDIKMIKCNIKNRAC